MQSITHESCNASECQIEKHKLCNGMSNYAFGIALTFPFNAHWLADSTGFFSWLAQFLLDSLVA